MSVKHHQGQENWPEDQNEGALLTFAGPKPLEIRQLGREIAGRKSAERCPRSRSIQSSPAPLGAAKELVKDDQA